MRAVLCLLAGLLLAPLLAGDTFTLEASVGPASADGVFRVSASCRRGDGVTAAELSGWRERHQLVANIDVR